MQQQLSVITIGIADLARSKRFYRQGFGWAPVFENDEIVFYQMNGFVLGTWAQAKLEEDMQRPGLQTPGAFSLAHNVRAKEDVQPLLDALVAAGGTLLRGHRASYGGFSGYVADPDGHAWEVAFNAQWPISPEGYVTFGV